MFFQDYGLQKTWLERCLKNPTSEDPFTRHIVDPPKHCCYLDNSTITIFSDHLEGK